jgi:hypothetical protein
MRTLLVLLVACSSPQQHAAPTSNTIVRNDAVVISLDRTVCLGWCPEYKVTITGTGHVVYSGDSYVKNKGPVEASISTAKVDELVRAFEEAKFTTFPSNMEGNITDVPTLHLTYRDKTVTYSDAVMVRGSPDEARRGAVDKLADKVDRAVDIEQWIGTAAEREAIYWKDVERRVRESCARRPTKQQQDVCLENELPDPPKKP